MRTFLVCRADAHGVWTDPEIVGAEDKVGAAKGYAATPGMLLSVWLLGEHPQQFVAGEHGGLVEVGRPR